MNRPLIERKWTHEGICMRRDNVQIFLPLNVPYYMIRRVGSITGKPLEPGECNIYDRKIAFKMGNKLVRQMKRKK